VCETLSSWCDKLTVFLGIEYDNWIDDSLSWGLQCEYDAAFMKSVGANSVRVRSVEAEYNHVDCMAAFARAGIYAWVSLGNFSYDINRVSKDSVWRVEHRNS
jgi:hypothetical protein